MSQVIDAISSQIQHADGFGFVLAILLIGGMLLGAVGAVFHRALRFVEVLFRGYPPEHVVNAESEDEDVQS